MASLKVAITLDSQLLRTVDRWVRQGCYPNRSLLQSLGLIIIQAQS